MLDKISLCVATTMMTMVMERKQEIALKKVLGAQNKALSLEFLSEAAVLALAGTFVGLIYCSLTNCNN